MKKLIWIAGILALGTTGSVFAEEVDFRAVNPVLQTLVDATISADDLVDFAYPRFDEKFCSAKEERLKYDLQGAMKNTPWLEGGRAEIWGTSTYVVDRTAGHTGVKVALTSSVRATDTLALIRYAAYLAQRKTSHLDPKFDARYQAHLKRLAVATSLDQVYDLAVSGQLLAKDLINDELARREERLRCLESGPCAPQATPSEVDYARRKVADVRATIPAYDRLKIEASRGGGGHSLKIVFSSPDMSEFIFRRELEHDFFLIPGAGSVTLSDTALSGAGEGFHKVPVADLDRFHADLERILVGVQNGNLAQKDEAQSHYREALIEFKKFIRGEN